MTIFNFLWTRKWNLLNRPLYQNMLQWAGVTAGIYIDVFYDAYIWPSEHPHRWLFYRRHPSPGWRQLCHFCTWKTNLPHGPVKLEELKWRTSPHVVDKEQVSKLSSSLRWSWSPGSPAVMVWVCSRYVHHLQRYLLLFFSLDTRIYNKPPLPPPPPRTTSEYSNA